MVGTDLVEVKAGSVGYTQGSERILTISNSIGIKFNLSHTHGTNYQGQRVVFLHGLRIVTCARSETLGRW